VSGDKWHKTFEKKTETRLSSPKRPCRLWPTQRSIQRIRGFLCRAKATGAKNECSLPLLPLNVFIAWKRTTLPKNEVAAYSPNCTTDCCQGQGFMREQHNVSGARSLVCVKRANVEIWTTKKFAAPRSVTFTIIAHLYACRLS